MVKIVYQVKDLEVLVSSRLGFEVPDLDRVTDKDIYSKITLRRYREPNE